MHPLLSLGSYLEGFHCNMEWETQSGTSWYQMMNFKLGFFWIFCQPPVLRLDIDSHWEWGGQVYRDFAAWIALTIPAPSPKVPPFRHVNSWDFALYRLIKVLDISLGSKWKTDQNKALWHVLIQATHPRFIGTWDCAVTTKHKTKPDSRMSAVITHNLISVTKCKTITFIVNSRNELPWLSANFIRSQQRVYTYNSPHGISGKQLCKYLHPEFLSKWYEHLMQILNRYQL